MNFVLGIVASSVAVLMLVGFACVRVLQWAYKEGRKKGFEEGRERGRREGDNWWIRAESEVDEARVKIWREEAQL